MRNERVEYASPNEVKLIKKEEQNKLSGHFVNKFRSSFRIQIEEFDPGSDWTLAACLTHASRTAAQHNFGYVGGEWRTGE